MAWSRIGDKPLSEPMMLYFIDAHMHINDLNKVTEKFALGKQEQKLAPLSETTGGRNKMATILQTIFWNIYSPRMKTVELLCNLHRTVFSLFQLTICQHCFRYWFAVEQVTSHYPNQWCPSLQTHIVVTRPKWGISSNHSQSDRVVRL